MNVKSITIGRVAEITGLSKGELRAMREKGDGPAFRTLSNGVGREAAKIFYDPASVESWMEEQTRTVRVAADKAERFHRLASSRTLAVLGKIEILGHLAHRGNYSYTSQQVDEIFGAIRDELDELEDKFRATNGKVTKTFELSRQ